MDPRLWSNATKAQIVAIVNAILVALPAFGILTDNTQMGAVVGIFNVSAAMFVGGTYKQSPNRISDHASPALAEEARNPS